MPANYNNSAWFYDRLSRVVYRKALINAQIYLLQFIPANTNVLIVGGGTGLPLEEITKIHPSGLNITYVEIASNMMGQSKKRNVGNNQVVFIEDAIENTSIKADFDIAITPFLFDNFTQQTLQRVFKHIHSLLKPGGLWLNCDFQLTGKWWQRVLLRSMFLFFRIICDIEASKLPDIEKQFEICGYKVMRERTFYGDFIVSRVYKAG